MKNKICLSCKKSNQEARGLCRGCLQKLYRGERLIAVFLQKIEKIKIIKKISEDNRVYKKRL